MAPKENNTKKTAPQSLQSEPDKQNESQVVESARGAPPEAGLNRPTKKPHAPPPRKPTPNVQTQSQVAGTGALPESSTVSTAALGGASSVRGAPPAARKHHAPSPMTNIMAEEAFLGADNLEFKAVIGDCLAVKQELSVVLEASDSGESAKMSEILNTFMKGIDKAKALANRVKDEIIPVVSSKATNVVRDDKVITRKAPPSLQKIIQLREELKQERLELYMQVEVLSQWADARDKELKTPSFKLFSNMLSSYKAYLGARVTGKSEQEITEKLQAFQNNQKLLKRSGEEKERLKKSVEAIRDRFSEYKAPSTVTVAKTTQTKGRGL